MLLCSGTTKVRGTNREDLNDSLEHPPSTKYTVCTQLSNSIGQMDGSCLWSHLGSGSTGILGLGGPLTTWKEAITGLYWSDEEVRVIWNRAHHDTFLTGSRQWGGGLEDLCTVWRWGLQTTVAPLYRLFLRAPPPPISSEQQNQINKRR